jgi:hypothetical protein
MAFYILRKRQSIYIWSAAACFILSLGAVSCGSGSASSLGAVALACTLPANAQVGIAYNGSCLASGGTAPYTYSISSGSLPNGLSINSSTGAITGIPTAPGGNAFTVSVSTSNSQTASEVITYFIVYAPSPQSGTVTVTATSGGIVNSVSIPVTVL